MCLTLLVVTSAACSFDWDALEPSPSGQGGMMGGAGGAPGVGGSGGVGAGGAGGLGGAALGPWTNIQPISALNTADNEDDAAFTADGLELYFNRDIEGGNADIWVSTRMAVTDDWGAPAPADSLNSSGHDGDVAISPDGLTIWLASDRSGMGQILVATRAERTAAWSTPQPVAELNTVDEEELDSVAGDGLAGVIDRRVSGAPFDLFWISRSDTQSPWEAPVPIDALNTAANDREAWLSPDASTIYFGSTRDDGIDKIYVTTRANGTWADPTIVDELSDGMYQSDPWVSADQRYMTFTVGRNPDRDIYEASR